MITDDSRFLRTMLKKTIKSVNDELSDYEFKVIQEADNGQDAVELYKKIKPDIVTMDITMPAKGGIEALTEILQYDPCAVVLMCSAMGQKPMITEAIKIGAKDFLIKPFEVKRVKQGLVSSSKYVLIK